LRGQIVKAIGEQQQRGFGLTRLGRLGFDLQPEGCQFERQIILPGRGGNLGGARDDFRIAGTTDKIGPGADAQLRFAALQREVDNQRQEDGAGEQVLVRDA